MAEISVSDKGIKVTLTSRLNRRHNTVCAGLGYMIADAIAYLGDFDEATLYLA